ncbi:MAG: hypothetical protein CSA35_01095 [Dethiosulfovibrio peptidovorans]|nr:MAG: hypothetical protein CSA35_01095 [Dethiosulfovibrio peptidovorans]
MFKSVSILKLFGGVVGIVMLTSQACALSGAVPLLISKPDYDNNYVSLAVAQDCPGAYGLTADGYPVVRDIDGHWVYVPCTCRGDIAVSETLVNPVTSSSAATVAVPQTSSLPSTAVLIMPQTASWPMTESVVESGQSNLSPVLSTPMVSSKTKVKTQPKRARVKSNAKTKSQPKQKNKKEPEINKKIIIHGNPKPLVEPKPVVEPVAPQSGDDSKVASSVSVYLPSPSSPDKYEVLAPDPSMASVPKSDQPQMIVIRTQ